ncbi:GYF domain-containing protein [Paraliomyxa miuraensis]|uniref:GYF domain-containing protein n=1 Tax=Paraliomyxa miuraensis TaxID=376150 RepID=UPI0022552EB1|nr:GYF domain-containing protein [Paraliomyxa miuraensis]MCX4242346.1 zinc-ribbon domain-containing protein [Paraliomyxa miuraensis]
MKIECDKCSAKYSIADEKVRGKTFKIRCKKCSNVIIVRDKGMTADAGAGAAAAEQAAPGWHLAINGETVGPMAEDEVRQRYAAGEIDKDTAVWQEGFDDWLPLGDVDAFSDLPERNDDPFAASANQDDYAAGGARAGGVAAAAAVAATGTDGPSEQPQSPRVSKLTGQRNENSVLFSLDSLQAMATASAASPSPAVSAPAARASSNPSKGLATSAPTSEGSGLIDIRSLGSMVGSGPSMAASAAPQAAADDAALPSFGGGGFGGLAATPLVAPTTPDSSTPAPPAVVVQPRSNAPLYIMMVLLIAAVGGLGWYIANQKPPETKTIVQEVPVVAPNVKDDDDKDKDKDKDDEDKDKKDDKAGEGESEGGSGGESEGEEVDDGKGGKVRKSGGSRKSGSSGGTASSGSAGSSTAGGSGGTKTDTKKDEDSSPSVECILDPSKCGKSTKKSSGGSSGGGSSGGSSNPSAPEKLSPTDLKAGLASVKAEAKSCGAKNGAKAGEKVQVKLSLSGSTGTVSKATPLAPHAGTSLGNCVAAAAKKAKFKEFKNATMGFQYSFTM